MAAQALAPALAARRLKTRRLRLLGRLLEGLALAVAFVAVLFPITWMVLTAFKSPADIYHLTLTFTPTLDNFREVFGVRWQIGAKVLNSLIIAVGTVIIAIRSRSARPTPSRDSSSASSGRCSSGSC
jgi:ABC-type glycerol-3-phosphate transport system permease component